MTPRDYFSNQSAEYARYRPRYPQELFTSLSSLAPAHDVAWDCATGTGQAAVCLAPSFDRVIATDISANQIAHAEPHEHVEYRVAPADSSGIESASVGLVNVAQALHWLELEAFYDEVNRVLVQDGILAVTSYGSARLDTPELAEIFTRFELETMKDYWPPRRRFVGERLRDAPFPFQEIPMPGIPLFADWTLDQLLGYARSWSASAAYEKQHGGDPIRMLDSELRPVWGDPEVRHTVSWPFIVRVGRVHP